ncbi:MAG: YciI family protein [Myxococcales bacterium]|nr:YciI family protein [Myxococcales bacterium]
MKVMVMVKATANSEAGKMPDASLLQAMGAYNEALMAAGVLCGGEGLHPSARGLRVRFDGDAKTVTEGPFVEPGVVAGFWLWQVASLDEALAWAKRCPSPMPGEAAELELRPVFEADDFGEAMTPELRAREDALRAQLASETP